MNVQANHPVLLAPCHLVNPRRIEGPYDPQREVANKTKKCSNLNSPRTRSGNRQFGCILWYSKLIVENSCSVADSTRQSCHVLVLYFSGHVFVRSISWPSHVVNLSTFGRQKVDGLHETRRALYIGLEEAFLGCSGLWSVKNWCS